jgi:hypothetical protein
MGRIRRGLASSTSVAGFDSISCCAIAAPRADDKVPRIRSLVLAEGTFRNGGSAASRARAAFAVAVSCSRQALRAASRTARRSALEVSIAVCSAVIAVNIACTSDGRSRSSRM